MEYSWTLWNVTILLRMQSIYFWVYLPSLRLYIFGFWWVGVFPEQQKGLVLWFDYHFGVTSNINWRLHDVFVLSGVFSYRAMWDFTNTLMHIYDYIRFDMSELTCGKSFVCPEFLIFYLLFYSRCLCCSVFRIIGWYKSWQIKLISFMFLIIEFC